MKISKATRWILTIGILAILLISLGVFYGRQKPEQSRLILNVAQARQDFIKYTSQYATQKQELEVLEARLNEANSRIVGLQSEFGQYTESIEINEALFEAADDANVTIISLASSCPTDEEISGIPYRVFTLEITAEGEVPPALINFGVKMSETFATANIESVAMDVARAEEEGESEGESVMTLRVKIYVHE